MIKTLHFFLVGCCLLCVAVEAQNDTSDSQVIRNFYNQALRDQQGYKWLGQLTRIGGRLAGSKEADQAVTDFAQVAEELGFQIHLQKVRVPHWERGAQETGYIVVKGQQLPVNLCALGGSVATPAEGLEAEVVEITHFNQLDSLDLSNKIAFFNIPMDPTFINPFFAYGSAVKQRWAGAVEASKRGAIGVAIRSLSSSVNKYPHTGSMTYDGAEKKIPAVALSTFDANVLSDLLANNSAAKLHFRTACSWADSTYSYNLIAEIKGAELPNEIIAVGGHIDSWDLATGAHDDGAGCMHALEAAYLLKAQNKLPKRTLRVVFFMNEEFGLNGARAYALEAKKAGEKHVLALESDAGGFSPRGLSIKASDASLTKIKALRDLLEPYGIHQFFDGGGGADINQLTDENIVLIGLRPDGQRYFEIHHSALDTLDAVNPREFELGSATLASVIYLLDKYDIVGK
jgi:hypothetical protein